MELLISFVVVVLEGNAIARKALLNTANIGYSLRYGMGNQHCEVKSEDIMEQLVRIFYLKGRKVY